MIRIQVIKASRLALAVSGALLAAALALLAIRYFSAENPGGAVYAPQEKSHMVQAAAVFAAASHWEGGPSPSPRPPRQVILSGGEEEIQIEIMPRATPKSEKAPLRVLIYHTHTHEAYQQVTGQEYQALEAWRTLDQNHSVVRVGEELARHLTGLGIETVHDVTDHEPPKLGTAYTRSLETLKKYADQPFHLYIDLHRDAWDQSMPENYVIAAGEKTYAPLMLLIGNGEGFLEKPDYGKNLAFARRLTGRINALQPGLCRPVLVKDGRYNQHMRTPSILVEAGHNKNTLSQALASMEILAQAIGAELGG